MVICSKTTPLLPNLVLVAILTGHEAVLRGGASFEKDSAPRDATDDRRACIYAYRREKHAR